MNKRANFLDRIKTERERQFNLPGSEWDTRNTPNDFIAIATHYLAEEARRGGNIPSLENFEDGLIKAAAVILAALENAEEMRARKDLR